MNGPTNPYIAGNPITGTEMFFGRQDVFRFVRETLVGRYQDNAIVLYGGRRTGKTSVLYQMERHLDPVYVPVFVDLQGISLEGMGEMLWGIARQAARVLRRQRDLELKLPSREAFAADPEGCFREGFLDQALQALGDGRLLLMVDEAMRIHEQVQAGKLERRIFNFLRSLIQYHPRLNFIFSIGSGLEQIRSEYALLFSLCQYRKISFLDRDAAEALIVKPVESHYRYAPGAVDRILEVTHGQPYYTQLVCNRLFARWARRGGDEVTLADVDAILDEAVEQGMASLQYTWEEASDAAKVVLAALVERMGDDNRPVSTSALREMLVEQEVALPRRAVGTALRELVSREVLRPVSGGYTFNVDLMRLWVKQYQRLEWVRGQISVPEEVPPPARRKWVQIAPVAAAAALLLIVIVVSTIVWSSVEADRRMREATAVAMSGTVAALETRIAQGGGDAAEQHTLEAQLALLQTQSAEMQVTVTPPPQPSDTSLPTTDTPVPPSTDTPVPPPTETPELCSFEIGPAFSARLDAYPDALQALGCPTAERQQGEAAEQGFQHGRMLWKQDAREVYIVYDDGTFGVGADPYVEGDPDDACPEVGDAPEGLYKPVRGFNRQWCNVPGVREGLGWALELEVGYGGAWQRFRNGLVIQSRADHLFVLYDEGTWEYIE